MICAVALFTGWILSAAQIEAFAQKRPVYVTASFLDKNDLFIENLERSEIQILEEGNTRKIEFMAKDELQVAYGIVFDRGMLPESIDEERYTDRAIPSAASARNIAYELIDKCFGRQVIWVAGYERELQVVAENPADGFAAKSAIQQLRGRRTPLDSFLYSALFSAVQRMNERPEKRRILVLFLQDLDSETAGKMKPLKNLLSASNVELIAVGFTTRLGGRPTALQPTATMTSLQELARVTSGAAYFTMNYRDHYEDIVRRIHNQVRTYYTFGFEADSGASSPGKLLIKCSRPGSKVTCHPLVPAFP